MTLLQATTWLTPTGYQESATHDRTYYQWSIDTYHNLATHFFDLLMKFESLSTTRLVARYDIPVEFLEIVLGDVHLNSFIETAYVYPSWTQKFGQAHLFFAQNKAFRRLDQGIVDGIQQQIQSTIERKPYHIDTLLASLSAKKEQGMIFSSRPTSLQLLDLRWDVFGRDLQGIDQFLADSGYVMALINDSWQALAAAMIDPAWESTEWAVSQCQQGKGTIKDLLAVMHADYLSQFDSTSLPPLITGEMRYDRSVGPASQVWFSRPFQWIHANHVAVFGGRPDSHNIDKVWLDDTRSFTTMILDSDIYALRHIDNVLAAAKL